MLLSGLKHQDLVHTLYRLAGHLTARGSLTNKVLCRHLVDRWAYGQMLCQAHPASRERGLPSLPTPACKVLLFSLTHLL